MKNLPLIVFGVVLIYAGSVIAYDKCRFGGAVWCSSPQLDRKLP